MTHTTNKTIKTAHERYTESTLYTLRDCYGRYSDAKESAFGYCMNQMHNHNGRQPRIISYNQNIFTFGFIGEIDGKSAFFYITPAYDRYIFLDEMEG